MPLNRSAFTGQVKEAAAAHFPSLLVRWQLMRRPKAAEAELSLLPRLVSPADVTVDVGANLGLYARVLAHLSSRVHAFEPSHSVAEILRRTSPANVTVYEMALSDQAGQAELKIPRDGDQLSYGLATLEPAALIDQDFYATRVRCGRLDSVVHDDVSFVKIDVEGHELQVLQGALGLIDRCRPSFLVEAEERHRPHATAQLFAFFKSYGYNGYFLCDDTIFDVDVFDPRFDQDPNALLSNGGRRKHCHYINNFLFFPEERDQGAMLVP